MTTNKKPVQDNKGKTANTQTKPMRGAGAATKGNKYSKNSL